MIERETARTLAQKAVGDQQLIDPDRYTETREGWYFPYARQSEMVVGSNGVIVNKRSGRAFVLGSAFPIERDIKAFDEGFQFDLYDLVILEICDHPRTVASLVEVGPPLRYLSTRMVQSGRSRGPSPRTRLPRSPTRSFFCPRPPLRWPHISGDMIVEVTFRTKFPFLTAIE